MDSTWSIPKVAAYCRVSTDKEDQLMSLKAQQEFFREYAQRSGFELVRLYTDEGISGTKLKNRKEFNRMMADAERGLFEQVYVKDVSRLARNVVDFLQSIRRLKALGIDCRFVTANMSSNDGELTLTILAAVAQEESANLSKRVKFGKRKNAENGKVPNLVFGYDKTPGDYFHLTVNEREAAAIRRMVDLYLESGLGASKIARLLNQDGVLTKRGCEWSQNSVRRVLTNPLYTGLVINGKESVEDFLTGRRVAMAPEKRLLADRPELQIITPEQFQRVQRLMGGRMEAFQREGTRQSSAYPLSTLIRCAGCGRGFRRISHQRRYGSYVRWVCSTRNTGGQAACGNGTMVDEQALTDAVLRHLREAVSLGDRLAAQTAEELRRRYRPDLAEETEQGLADRLAELKKAKRKQTQMFEADVITLEELKGRTSQLSVEIASCERRLEALGGAKHAPNRLEAAIGRYCQSLESLLAAELVDNRFLKSLVDRIEVSSQQAVTIHMRDLSGASGKDLD